ncbi:MAG: hypothetical protein CMJ18_06080 [Phycisphaeraceae bacterium]|nr:hypothetical protein [Phycisphaeraceae bacterium]
MQTSILIHRTVVVCAALAIAFASDQSARATIDVDIDFSATSGPGSPAGEGYLDDQLGSPAGNTLIAGGVFDVDLQAGQGSGFLNNAVIDDLSPGATVLSGEISLRTPSSAPIERIRD